MNNKNLFAFVGVIILILIAITAFGMYYKYQNDIYNGTLSGDRREPPNMQDDNGAPPDKSGMENLTTNVTYSAKNNITENSILSNESFSSDSKDENTILIDSSAIVTIENSTINKTGDSEGGDISSFYGNNSAILAKGGSEVTINNASITTDATGANGVFCFGGSATTNNYSSDGTTIVISDSMITTSKDNSGGIMTTGGGSMSAKNLTITTAGTSSAAIRTDRGGGTVKVDGGTYKTTGQGSPVIYSTADVSVSNANLSSTSSEGIIIEGKNSVSIDNCELMDSNTKLNGKSTTYKNIFLYQSMSEDAEFGVAKFTSKDSNITTNNGDTIYVTNTSAVITLENNVIKNNDANGNFLRVQKDSWGNSETNGGDVTLVLNNQKVDGNIVVDSISTADITLKTNSIYEGIINGDNTAKALTLTLDASSKIKLTGDSYITSLTDDVDDYSNIDFNGYKLYLNGIAIN